ncbi:MAG: FAD:protein FMN transferase [Gammaproteobacteria bacterium]|nr:FAD:protein FMN transferase [Gammaproteobacteria bacterium]
MKFRLTLSFFTLLILTGCERAPEVYRDQFLAFGTIVSISIWDSSEEQSLKASRVIRDDFAAMHDTWHAWKRGGLLSEINQAFADGAPIQIASEASSLLKKTALLSRQSGALFNPAIGNLIALWGFHGEEWSGPPPSQEEIDILIQNSPSMDGLQFNNGTVSSNNRNIKIDLGGIAKGYAVDRAITKLKSLGIKNAIVNTGGDLRAIGNRGESAWSIGIQSPDGKGAIASINPQNDESIFTSGDYERMFIYAGKRYHHIINPKTGWPATGARSATVIHSDAMVADAAATAMLIASPEERSMVAAQMGIRYVLVIGEDGIFYMTTEMQDRLHFQQDTTPKIRQLNYKNP